MRAVVLQVEAALIPRPWLSALLNLVGGAVLGVLLVLAWSNSPAASTCWQAGAVGAVLLLAVGWHQRRRQATAETAAAGALPAEDVVRARQASRAGVPPTDRALRDAAFAIAHQRLTTARSRRASGPTGLVLFVLMVGIAVLQAVSLGGPGWSTLSVVALSFLPLESQRERELDARWDLLQGQPQDA